VTCGECRELISDHLDGQLQGASRSEFIKHLDECPDCLRALSRMRAVKTSLGALPRYQLPDAFGFRVRRMLIEESEREASWVSRVREWLWPSPQTAWAAASGTVAAVASFALLWAIWAPVPFSNGSNIAEVANTEKQIVHTDARAVRYVLEQLPNRGDLIETTAIADSTRYNRVYTMPVGVRSVSADF